MQIIDLDEGRDRRLKMLLDTASNIRDYSLQKQQMEMNKQKLAMEQQNLPYERAQMRVKNREGLASARYKEGLLSGKVTPGNATPRFVMNEDGTMTQLPGILVETPNQKLTRKLAGATEDQKNQLQANQNAGLVFNELKKLSSGLENMGGYQGIAVKAGNVITRGKVSPQAQAYTDFMPAAAVNLYRGITGDTRLSDYDAKRAYSMVWNIDQDGNVKGIKEGAVQNLLQARNILLSNNVYATNKEDKITSLDDVMFVSNAVAKGVPEDQIVSYLKNKKVKK